MVASVTLSGCLFGGPEPVDVASGAEAEEDQLMVFGEGLEEGVHYRTYEPIDDNLNPVTVLFWYGCPHCQNLRPALSAFEQRTGEAIDEKHALFSQRWVADAAFFYTANQYGMRFPRLHEAYFDARTLQANALSESELDALLQRKGMTLEQFVGRSDSDKMNAGFARVKDLQKHYEVVGVPTVIVGGRYVLNNGAFQNNDHMMASAEALMVSMGGAGEDDGVAMAEDTAIEELEQPVLPLAEQ